MYTLGRLQEARITRWTVCRGCPGMGFITVFYTGFCGKYGLFIVEAFIMGLVIVLVSQLAMVVVKLAFKLLILLAGHQAFRLF